jgi:hypothetical protein
MSEHTPTPWEVLGTPFGPKIYTVQRYGAAVCQFFPFHEKGRNPKDAFLNAAANAALIVRAVNAHAQLVDSLTEMLEPYYEMEPADLFAKLPGEEAQRVVRARAVLASLKETV